MEAPEGVVDPYELALVELERGVLPFVVLRELPDGSVERVEV